MIANRISLISAGTERSKVVTARKSLLGKARARPDQVRQVMQKLRQAGFWETLQTVRGRLARDEPLGYSAAGEVLLVGDDVEGIRPGDRVACAGAGYANHAEVVVVPKHLCARIPEGVTWEDAAFGTVGAIALHAVRQADVGIGDRVLVVGLGLVGQLVTQIATASGGVVAGTDLSGDLCQKAQENGAIVALSVDQVGALVRDLTSGCGFDVVIVAAADSGHAAFDSAVSAVRDRGRIVIVGAVGVSVENTVKSRLYEREIEVRLARSYGPGRYDSSYEEQGRDYPFAYVRWTEQRNISAFLEAVQRGLVRPRSMVSARFPVDQAAKAFEALAARPGVGAVLGILLTYGETEANATITAGSWERGPIRPRQSSGDVQVAVIGAGNFARVHLLPHLRKISGVRLVGVTTASGLSVDAVKKEFGIDRGYAGPDAVFDDPEIDAVLIATRHDTHAEFVRRALKAGKHAYVEKPLALTWDGLKKIRCQLHGSSATLMVGFNRRFSPQVACAKEHVAKCGRLTALYRVNAGAIAPDSWYADPWQGGGRFLGEAGHFIDTLRHLVGSPISTVYATETRDGKAAKQQGTIIANVTFANGSTGSVAYVSEGPSKLAKERLEIFADDRAAVLDDFHRVELYRQGEVNKRRFDGGKGHREEMLAWIRLIREGVGSELAQEYLEVTAATIAAVESLAVGSSLDLAGWPDE